MKGFSALIAVFMLILFFLVTAIIIGLWAKQTTGSISKFSYDAYWNPVKTVISSFLNFFIER